MKSSLDLCFRQYRAWLRSPRFYLHKARVRMFGEDIGFLQLKREEFAVGTHQWLALSEQLYGGFQVNVLGKASTLDQSTGKDQFCAYLGGDRMSPGRHDYGRAYAEFLYPLATASADQRITLVEVGILNGQGLAIWCDLFPKARIIGLDLDVSNFQGNLQNLKELGAFQHNQPEVYSFDQFDTANAGNIVREVLGDDLITVAIDDGHHSLQSIENTFEAVQPLLAKRFVYFIEDNFDTYEHLAPRHPLYRWHQRGELTVLTERGL